MKTLFLISLFMLATLAWAAAQQPGAMPHGSGGQATSPNPQIPDASQSPGAGAQSQGSMPGSTSQQGGADAAAPSANAPVTEGCLGGANPNYTITDNAGKKYKLNIPAGADASPLQSHVGESVAVMGPVSGGSSDNASIDVSKIGRGTTKCPGGSKGAETPPSQ